MSVKRAKGADVNASERRAPRPASTRGPRTGRSRTSVSATTAAGKRDPLPLLIAEVQVARLLGVGRSTVRHWSSAGILCPVELPLGVQRVLYRRADVERFIAELDPATAADDG